MNGLNLNQVNCLPHVQAAHASIRHAVKFKLCSESFLSAPRSAVVDGIISYGGSTGIGLNLAAKAYSEFYERNHLFAGIPIDCVRPLSAIEPHTYREKLLNLCQISHNKDKAQCLAHEFSWVRVNNLFDHHAQYYFFNGLSLNGVKKDVPFLGFSDSCACAAHPVKEKALESSLMEFLERQALLGSWLSKSTLYAINPQVLSLVTPYAELAEMLLENGQLYVFSNGRHLPAHTVIMFYFAHSEKDTVQYSIGSSSGFNLQAALTASLEELYQCYSFLYNTESSSGLENKAGAGYHLSFQQCNHRDVKKTIPFLNEHPFFHINHPEEVYAAPVFSLEEVLAELEAVTNDIYYYHHHEKSLDLHITKIMSPDFFAHMAINKPLNFENRYAQKLGISKENAYLEKIPFP
ncbi:YcaO-like family protein [Legionella londiniensis]|uniref:YcaO-like family protein n=1 Tax=Legionella londiniensis TaxID=45068 RepID=A0A0W0VHF1_9GAMM|nr:YcaO-like family protein [Legionella londiniensis]KTD19553.1 YcaO-like family protein [Legionella londiniensis]STX92225.1 bacteriocin biosynthesis docking scaffold, SagD family [Legionella londiniensis]